MNLLQFGHLSAFMPYQAGISGYLPLSVGGNSVYIHDCSSNFFHIGWLLIGLIHCLARHLFVILI